MQNKVLLILFITLLLDMIGAGMVIPIIPVIFTDPTSKEFILHGYSQASQFLIAGVVTALFGLMQFIAAPLLGELSDYYGRKKLLLLGIGTLAISQAFFGFGIMVQSLTIIFISRLIAGLAAANFSIAQAMIADITSPQDRAKNFGLIGAAFGIGFIIGPLAGGWISHWTENAAAPFMVAGLLGILNFLFCMLLLPETRKNVEKTSHNFHPLKGIHNLLAAYEDKKTLPIYLASFLYMSGFTFLMTFSSIFQVTQLHFTEGDVGTYFAAIGVLTAITQLVILPILVKKYHERAILRISMLSVGTAVALYPFMGTVALVYLILPFIAIPQGLTMANMTALISKNVDPNKQGAALGINGSLIALAGGIIPLTAGGGAALLGIKAPFIAGGLLIFAAWSALFLRRNPHA
ncbi:MAG TPA: MFS transporter [Patescibacteria group bacterium]|nr:MFS transporter [Patescibacteria group bacterium]